jgi:hypothetical protein
MFFSTLNSGIVFVLPYQFLLFMLCNISATKLEFCGL